MRSEKENYPSEIEWQGQNTENVYYARKQLFMKVNMLGAANMIINQIPPETPIFMQTLKEMQKEI